MTKQGQDVISVKEGFFLITMSLKAERKVLF